MGMIAFVGLPGSGKTTVGKQVATKLSLPFIDTDRQLELKLGCSIRSYFDEYGESNFRALESSLIDELTLGGDAVLSTGGGAILSDVNRGFLRERTKVIYLHSLPEEVFKRLRYDRTRPLLQVSDPLARIHELYLQRDALYRGIASVVIETGKPPVAGLVAEILTRFNAGRGLHCTASNSLGT